MNKFSAQLKNHGSKILLESNNCLELQRTIDNFTNAGWILMHYVSTVMADKNPRWDIDDDLLDREIEKKKEPNLKHKKPSMFQVVFHNDDYTPMDFVVMVLEKFFHKSQADAVSIMMDVHKTGKGIAGVYSFEIAEQKVMETMDLARAHEFPLLLSIEEV